MPRVKARIVGAALLCLVASILPRATSSSAPSSAAAAAAFSGVPLATSSAPPVARGPGSAGASTRPSIGGPGTASELASGVGGGGFANQPLIPFRGVTVLLYGNDPSFATKTAVLLDRLAGLGAHSVSLTIPFFQSASVSATDVHMDPVVTPTLANLRIFIAAAHQRGMSVLLRPLLDDLNIQQADNFQGQWRGTLNPQPRILWYGNYETQVLLPLASLGASAGLDVLDVGSELQSLEGDTAAWLNVISHVRGVYSGALTFSTNWGHPFPAFGGSLNFLGIDAFYPLSAPVNANVAQLVAAWQPWLNQAAQIRTTWGKPVVFTELGTTSQVGSFVQPWNWNNHQPVSLETQRLYYQAACQAARPFKIGLFWWAYNFDPLTSPSTDPGYDPQGKPAESEIARCYS